MNVRGKVLILWVGQKKVALAHTKHVQKLSFEPSYSKDYAKKIEKWICLESETPGTEVMLVQWRPGKKGHFLVQP